MSTTGEDTLPTLEEEPELRFFQITNQKNHAHAKLIQEEDDKGKSALDVMVNILPPIIIFIDLDFVLEKTKVVVVVAVAVVEGEGQDVDVGKVDKVFKIMMWAGKLKICLNLKMRSWTWKISYPTLRLKTSYRRLTIWM